MRYVLIGGGDIRAFETEKIDTEIVKMSGKSDTNILFIGLASSYSDSYYDAVKRQYKKLGCTCSYLKKSNLINNIELAINKIRNADIIYIGGGDSIKLIERVKEYKLDRILRELDDKHIIVGMSAGAILLSKNGLSDAYVLRGESEELGFVEGLGLVNLNICPHYNKDIRKTELKRNIISSKNRVLGLEDNAAVIVSGDKIKVLDGDVEHKVYECYWEDENYIEEVFYGVGQM